MILGRIRKSLSVEGVGTEDTDAFLLCFFAIVAQSSAMVDVSEYSSIDVLTVRGYREYRGTVAIWEKKDCCCTNLSSCSSQAKQGWASFLATSSVDDKRVTDTSKRHYSDRRLIHTHSLLHLLSLLFTSLCSLYSLAFRANPLILLYLSSCDNSIANPSFPSSLHPAFRSNSRYPRKQQIKPRLSVLLY